MGGPSRVVAGSSARGLGRELGKLLGTKPVDVEERAFPDGELYVRVPEDLHGEDVALVQSTYPNEKVVEFFFLQDALRDAGVRSLTAVIPYFGYGRQDRRFKEGESVSSRALARRIQMDADRLVTVDVHNERVLDYFHIPVEHVSGVGPLASYLQGRSVGLVVAPDVNASRIAKAVAAQASCPWEYLEKARIDSWTVQTKAKELPVAGRRVAIVDDVISTGGTIANAARMLREQGAAAVLAACIHGVFVEGALDRLTVCDEVIATDTLANPLARVSVAGPIAEALGKKI